MLRSVIVLCPLFETLILTNCVSSVSDVEDLLDVKKCFTPVSGV